MSCGKGNHHTGHCVCDVVKAISDAQNEVVENHCDVSCDRSIESLLDPAAANDLNTVPFILYGKDLKPFKAFGVDFQKNKNKNSDQKFDCVDSFIFKVKTVDHDCCAVLELLAFDDGDGKGGGSSSGGGGKHDEDTPCDQVDNEKLEDLVGTGICITVDLTCFCAITCLPAVSLA